MFRIIFLFVIGLGSLSLFAQQDLNVPLGNQMYDVFELTTTASTQTLSIEVNASSLTMDIYTSTNPVDVTIIDASGTTVPPANINNFTVAATEVPPLGAALFAEGVHTQVNIDDPVSGTWLVNISLPAGASALTGTMTTIQTGGLQVGAIVSRTTYNVGEPVVLAIAAYNAGAAVLSAVAEANVYQEGTELTPQTVVLLDDGLVPDTLSGDGLYTGQISGLPVGDYLVEAVLQSGALKAASAAQFEVIPVMGIITNNVTDAGVDTNADGMFERIDVSFEVDISVAGTYSLLAELKLGSETISKGTQVTFPVGLSVQALSFSTEDIKKRLNGDGPYEISDVRLIKTAIADGSQPTRLVDRRNDLGLTQFYQLSQFQRPLTLILEEGFTEIGVDTNGNGKFDTLDFTFLVDALVAGQYTWGASIKAPDGTTIATVSQVGSLSAGGLFRFPLSFDGATIGAAGFDGPYLLGDIGVYGPPDAAAARFKMGETVGYSASEFEGFIVAITGDFNGDDCVDRADYQILIADVRNQESNNLEYDLNNDGVVNRADARTLVGLFTNPRGAACIP
ncbi:hypothetical protein MNBD_GAMMA06-633 [hydrothermal vent metagenome]|uniref:Dockerin domain-containing protein n=1 Tax=hydrothermal vent metagenome TaxID=652676 RepID=A0A3B0X713_9ZZZZ